MKSVFCYIYRATRKGNTMEERDWDAETSRDEDENMEYLAEEEVIS